MIGLLSLCVSIAFVESPLFSESSPAAPLAVHPQEDAFWKVLQEISREVVYFEMGAAFENSSTLARMGEKLCQFFPQGSSLGKEFSLLSTFCNSAAKHAFLQLLREDVSPSSQLSWQINQKLLSRVPVASSEDRQLLHFLEERWLAKTAGFSATAVDIIYPCFGIHVQVNPCTNHSYARFPITRLSKAYRDRMEAWKQQLPHPRYFPLILTRSADLQEYLPPHLEVSGQETMREIVERLASKMREIPGEILLDLTALFPPELKEWQSLWRAYRNSLVAGCEEAGLDLTQLICVQRMQQEKIGGLRLLHLTGQSLELLEKHYQFLLEWISYLGLAANRIEIDRWPVARHPVVEEKNALFQKLPSREECLAILNRFDGKGKFALPHEALMVQGTLEVLKGFFESLKEEVWRAIADNPTRSSVAALSLGKIQEQLKLLVRKELSFPELTSHLEQIHADLLALLEVFSPFTSDQFFTTYRDLLSIPSHLKPLTSCGIHSSAMTSLSGIFHVAQKTLGTIPRVLYGENAYFECVAAAKKVTHASSMAEASEEDWKEADLLLSQFNPIMKLEMHSGYRVEKISEILHQCLSPSREKPLLLALDCTLDFLDSPRVAKLLEEFSEEIQSGILSVIGYRSGIKFDLFGMDNYCGAPFFMIHNRDPKWRFLDDLLTDPILQVDRLSLNWFCLAYRYAAPQLELYRKQIFENTRALLKKVPKRLLDCEVGDYWVSPVQDEADLAFLDLKVRGPFHIVRGSTLVGGGLYIYCIEGGLPIFNRPSLGFYHPNFNMFFGEETTSLRLTLGLDPSQVDLFAKYLETLDAL